MSRIKLLALLLEGGNIQGVNSAVPKELLTLNIRNSLKLSSMGSLKFSVVGNKNKPILGDIDIGVNSEDVSKLIGYTGDDKDEFWKQLDVFLKKQRNIKHYAVNKGFEQFHIVTPLIDKSRKHINAIDKNGNTLDELGYIQIDVFVGNLNWMKKALSGSPMSSKYKAVYRNCLFQAILGNLIFKTKDPDVQRKLQFNRKRGIELVSMTTNDKGKQVKFGKREIIHDMEKFVKFLFGPTVKFKDVNSYEKILKMFKSNKFLFPKQRSAIMAEFVKQVKRRNLELPDKM